jgi:hypothetical protein
MKTKSILFFRNDDIRGTLDGSLVELTGLFIKHKIPITHAVEPANVTPQVIDWLIETKRKYPSFIEIMQHGFDHKVKNPEKKGEFGGQRNYEEQYKDISQGKELMDKYFGKLWFPAFNFPYAPYNPEAIKAVNDCKFHVLNSHFNRRRSRQILYFVGHILNKGYLFDKHVSWNLDFYPNTNLFEIDMNVSFIRKYHNEETDCEMWPLEYIKEETRNYSKYKTIGILLHHRYHNSSEKMDMVDKYLSWVNKGDYEFDTIEGIYKKFCPDGK